MKQVITAKNAPAAIGPYSHAVLAGQLLFASGQIPLDPATGNLVEGDISAQAEQSLKNVVSVLESAGLTTADVIKTTVFIVDMNDFAAVNVAYAKYFVSECPARSCVAVAALPKGAKVEIEVIAYKG